MDHDLIAKHRDILVQGRWYRDVYADFDRICDILGLDVEPAFTGFWCQGDGASFTGSYDGEKADEAVAKIREYAPKDETLHKIADTLLMLNRMHFTIDAEIYRFSTHYVHECTIGVTVENADDAYQYNTLLVLEDQLRGQMRTLCRWLYTTLNREYDYLTSDEAVWDALVANDIAA